MNRREFLAATATAGLIEIRAGRSATETTPPPIQPQREAVLKLSIQEDKMPGEDFAAKLDRLEKWGFAAVELRGKGLPDRVKQVKDAMKGRALKISAVCTGIEGCLIGDKSDARAQAVKTAKEILTVAGELGSTGLIIVPAFNRQSALPHKEARQMLTGFARWDEQDRKREGSLLQELGEHATRCGTHLLLEPLNRQECYFMRTLADAASICKDIDNPGIAMMGDFWHMTWEETSDLGAFISAGKYLHHVHIASRRRRKMPGEDGEADNYVLGLKGLKWIGYQDYISMECGSVGNKELTIPAAGELIRKQWAQA